MANRIVLTTLLAGPRHTTIHAYLQSDGMEGEIDSYVLIDPDSRSQSGHLRIESVTWGFAGFNAKLHFEILVDDTLIWVLPETSSGVIDFSRYGGLKDLSNPLDGTGKLMLSTDGFQSTGDEGSLIIQVRND